MTSKSKIIQFEIYFFCNDTANISPTSIFSAVQVCVETEIFILLTTEHSLCHNLYMLFSSWICSVQWLLYRYQIFCLIFYDPLVTTWISAGLYCKLFAVFKICLVAKRIKLGSFIQDWVFFIFICSPLVWPQTAFILLEIQTRSFPAIFFLIFLLAVWCSNCISHKKSLPYKNTHKHCFFSYFNKHGLPRSNEVNCMGIAKRA